MRLGRRRPKISEVFNSQTAPHPEVFAARTDGTSEAERLQDRVADVLGNPGQHLVLWGFTGVGKTSLVEHVAKQLKLPYLKVQASRPLDERSAAGVLLENILAQLGYQAPVEVRRTGESSAGVHVGGRRAGARIGRKDSTAVLSAIRQHSLDVAVVRALAASRYRLLFIDAFEFIPLPERSETFAVLRAVMHELSDLASRNPKVAKVVTAGVAETIEELIPAQGPVARRVYELYVPRMSAPQLGEILQRGARLLRLSFDRAAVDGIVGASDGFPFYTHLFARHAVQHARRRSARDRAEIVTHSDYERSLDAALDGAYLRLAKPYLSAIEPTRTHQLRKLVLEAIAELEATVVSLDDIRQSYLRLNSGDAGAEKSGFFQRPLAQLVHEFAILIEMRQGGNRAKLYRFRDPLMRAYVRLHRRYPHLTAYHRARLRGG